jgi:ferredoxin/flavodoxin---NADP+ reductase
MTQFHTETVLEVRHWTDRLFSFRTTRAPSFRFQSGQFTMMGLEVDGKPLTRAYSMACAHYDDTLEFFSIKVPDGPLTSRLQHLKAGDRILVGRKAVGTLLFDSLLPGKRLWLLSTGTGLAPFLSIVQDPEAYERYEQVILFHGVRQSEELAYAEFIEEHLPKHELIGEMAANQLVYYPSVTRESAKNQGRITDLIRSGKIFADLGLPLFSPENDRIMLCGSPEMLAETKDLLKSMGFEEGSHSKAGHFVVERAFVGR